MANRRLERVVGDRGAAMVEFALTFLLLATIVFGAIDLGRAFFTWNQVKNAAREGAAYAERDPWSQAPSGSSCPNPDNIRYRAQNENGSARPELAVSTKRNGIAYSGCQTPASFPIDPATRSRLRVSTPFNPLSPLGGLIFGNPVIGAEVEVVVQ